MYDIYISNHLNAAGTDTVVTEELLYSIPIINSANAVKDPVVKCEMGKAGSFEFTVIPTHPFYNRFQQMKTLMRVVYDGTQIFRGRVLTIDTSPFTGNRKVHLEGDMAFLMDSYQEGTQDKDRPTTDIYAYLQTMIRMHNEYMSSRGDDYKQFTLGVVPGCANYTSITDPAQRITVENSDFGSSSWRKTNDAISELTKEYGGYFRTRYENGACYLDWLESFFSVPVNSQPIQVSENIIDINASSEVENLFTVLIPIGGGNENRLYIDGYMDNYHGQNREITVPQMAAYLVAQGRAGEMDKGFHDITDYQNAISQYGVIYKTQEFGDAKTKEQLWDTAINWIRDNYVGGITSFTVSALDLHHLNPSSNQKYIVGERVTIIYPDMSHHSGSVTPTITKTITLISAEYYLHSPDKNSYTMGIPNSLLSRSYSRSKGKTKQDAQNQSSGSNRSKAQDIEIQDIKRLAETFIVRDGYNIDEYEQLWNIDENKAKVAIDAATVLVRGVYQATEPTHVIIKNLTHSKTSADVGSIYSSSNGYQWKIYKVLPTSIEFYPLTTPATMPGSGRLTWVSGGSNHTAIVYGENQANLTVKVWVNGVNHDKTSADAGSIYKDSNNKRWVLDTIYSWKIRVAALDGATTLPSTGTLTWVSGGTHHSPITYGRTTTEAAEKVSKITTTAINGRTGMLEVGPPYNEMFTNWTDEEIRLANEIGKNLVIDAGASKISLKDTLSTAPIPGQIPPAELLKMSIENRLGSKSGSFKAYGNDKITNPNAPPTVSAEGADGSTNSQKVAVGTDGTGTSNTAVINGLNSEFFMLDLNHAGSTSDGDKNVEIKGGGTNGGELGVGKKSDGAGGKRWTITLNKTLKWTDEHGTEHTVPAGTVGAEDYYLENIPSFHTEFAKINYILSDYIATRDLVVENKAFINRLISSDSEIDHIYSKYVGTSNLAAAKVTVGSGGANSGLYSNTIYYQEPGMSPLNMVNRIWATMRFATKEGDTSGKMYLQGLPYNNQSGNWVDVAFFNIADTKFYKDAVSAAWNGGGATAHFVSSASSSTLEPGGSTTLYAYYYDDSSPAVPVRSYYSGTRRYSELTISARNLRLRTPQAPVTPTTSNQEIVPGNDSGGIPYDGLAKVVVKGDDNLTSGNIKSGTTIFGVNGSFTYDGTAAAGDILSGKTAYANGSKITGNIISKAAQTYYTSTSTQTISSGQYLSGNQSISAVQTSGIEPGNIKSGVVVKVGDSGDLGRIKNVTGTYTATPRLMAETVYPSTSEQAAEPDPGYDGLSKVTVKPIVISGTLTEANIKSGTRITIGNSATDLVDITGTYSGGGDPGGNVHGSSEIWDPSTTTKYSWDHEIPAGNSLDFVPWIHYGNTWYYGDSFRFKAGSGPSYTGHTFHCTSARQSYPGSATSIYTFTIDGNYSFVAGNDYIFYRQSW